MYDNLLQISQRQTACKLNVSKNILWMLKILQEIGKALLVYESSNRKTKRAGSMFELQDHSCALKSKNFQTKWAKMILYIYVYICNHGPLPY